MGLQGIRLLQVTDQSSRQLPLLHEHLEQDYLLRKLPRARAVATFQLQYASVSS
jgi:hypothetical protein